MLIGAPIDEPIVGCGPFVMNTEAEICEAFRDFADDRFSRIAATKRRRDAGAFYWFGHQPNARAIPIKSG